MLKPITISSVGDISFYGGFSEKDDLVKNWLADDVKNFLCADISIANMEYVILPDGETHPGGLCLAEPVKSFEALKHAGFNVLSLGNNHILDFQREKGMQETIRVINESGLQCCGAGMNIEEARKPAIIEKNGCRVAIFSRVHPDYFGNIYPIVADDNKPGVALLNDDELIDSVSKYKTEENCEIAVLCVHWGMQNVHYAPPVIHNTSEHLLNSGVDLILGSHSHVLQGLKQVNRKYCFLGQGNFYFYPFPLAGQPGGILYGPEATEHRISAVSKFSFDGSSWNADILPVYQNGETEKVESITGIERDELLNKVHNIWSNKNSTAFNLNWRRKYAEQRLKTTANPLKIVKNLIKLINPPSLG